jgi:DNA uptake protein ComE-like DNA-binding protein
MHKTWIALVVVLALLAGPALAGATATPDAKAAPAPSASAVRGKAPAARMSATPKKNLVNLNAASRQELKGLRGGSDEEAARIIAGRPYNSKAFLVTNNVISPARYEEIRNQVVAGKPTKPAAPKK